MYCMQNYIHHHINFFSSVCITKYLNCQSEADIYSKKSTNTAKAKRYITLCYCIPAACTTFAPVVGKYP